MTIHHDKLAYGKLASAREELTEEELLAMINELKEEDEEASEDDKNEKRGE